MDLHQLEYILAIEQEGSVSKAAKKLYITQSALNQQLLKLEQELGTPLFERRNRRMVPTLAGRIYLSTASRMMDMKQETYKIIHDISEENSGEISLAYTPEAGARMFAAVYPLFHRQYPNITFRIHEARNKKMEQLVLQKTVSFAFSSYYEMSRHPDLDYLDMATEYMVLAVPETHHLAPLAGENSWETLPIINLNLFQNDPFVLCSKETLLRDMIDYCFSRVGLSPKILFESTSTHTIVSMISQQIAPGFLPQSYAKPGQNMVYFTVPPQLQWVLAISSRKSTYLTKPEKYFIALAMNQIRGIPLNP